MTIDKKTAEQIISTLTSQMQNFKMDVEAGGNFTMVDVSVFQKSVM